MSRRKIESSPDPRSEAPFCAVRIGKLTQETRSMTQAPTGKAVRELLESFSGIMRERYNKCQLIPDIRHEHARNTFSKSEGRTEAFDL